MNIEESEASNIDSLVNECGSTDKYPLNYLDEKDRKLQREIDEWQRRVICLRPSSIHRR